MTAPLDHGRVVVTCPACEDPVIIPMRLLAVLKVKEGGESALSLSLQSKPVPHLCHSEQLTFDTALAVADTQTDLRAVRVDEATGEVLP